MRRALYGAIALAVAAQVSAQVSAGEDREIARQVYEDAKVVRRIADVAHRDLPREVLRQIIDEDLEALRGKTSEYEYRYAAWARTEANRREDRFGVETDGEAPQLDSFELDGKLVYRFRIQVPSRRLLLLSNRHVYVDRVDLTYLPVGASATLSESIDVKSWIDPGAERFIDVPRIAREAKAVVWASTDPGEKAALDVAVYRATLVDNPDSPFATVVRRMGVLDDAVDERDYRRLRTVADEVMALLEGRVGATPAARVAPLPGAAPAGVHDDDIYFELREIRVRLLGDEASRADGLRRLERLIERLRP